MVFDPAALRWLRAGIPSQGMAIGFPSFGTPLAYIRATHKTMQTLIRHAPTGEYFQSLEKWTTKREEAHDFKFMERALRFISKAGFSEMELILSLNRREQENAIHF